MIMLSVLTEISPLSEVFGSFAEGTGLEDGAKVLIKTVGITALAGFAADTCRDTGNSSLASRVELAAKLAIVALALPMINTVLTTVKELLSAG